MALMPAAIRAKGGLPLNQKTQDGHEDQQAQEVADPPEPGSQTCAPGGLRRLLTNNFEALDDEAEQEKQGDGRDKAGQEILLPGEGHRGSGLRPKDPLKIDLPDEGEDQDEDLHQGHHHQEAVEDVAFFQGIVKIEKSGHIRVSSFELL